MTITSPLSSSASTSDWISPATIFLPLPASPASSWALYRARLKVLFQGADVSVLLAFWLFGTATSLFLPCCTICSGLND
jgi:hypothetical protein